MRYVGAKVPSRVDRPVTGPVAPDGRAPAMHEALAACGATKMSCFKGLSRKGVHIRKVVSNAQAQAKPESSRYDLTNGE